MAKFLEGLRANHKSIPDAILSMFQGPLTCVPKSCLISQSMPCFITFDPSFLQRRSKKYQKVQKALAGASHSAMTISGSKSNNS